MRRNMGAASVNEDMNFVRLRLDYCSRTRNPCIERPQVEWGSASLVGDLARRGIKGVQGCEGSSPNGIAKVISPDLTCQTLSDIVTVASAYLLAIRFDPL